MYISDKLQKIAVTANHAGQRGICHERAARHRGAFHHSLSLSPLSLKELWVNIHYSRKAGPDKLCETHGADLQAVVLWGGGEKNSPLPNSMIPL